MRQVKNILLILFSTFTFQLGFGQHTIDGRIVDGATKENLFGVSIYISDLKTGANSDTSGYFNLDNIQTGTYLFEINFVGFKPLFERIHIDRDTTINFAMIEAHTELSEVVVTGVSRTSELKKIPIIVKSIDKNTLNQSSSTNLIDALKNIPGISQITTGASISKPVIRGLGYNRVISLFNGVRQEGQQWGDEHGIEIDEFEVDRIEIVKGPGSLMYGSDGIAGVLNFITPKAPPVGEIKTQLSSNYQSNNNLFAYSLSNAGNKSGVQWLGRFTNKYAGNYQNKYDSKVYNSGFNEYNGSVFLGINKNWGHSHIHINTFNTKVNLVEGDRDSLGNFVFIDKDGNEATATDEDLKGYLIGFPHQQINHLRVTSNNLVILRGGTMNIDLGFQNNKRKEFGDVTQPDDIALYFDLNTLNYNVRYNLHQMNGWETSFGIGGMQQSNKNKGIEFLIPEYTFFDAGGFVFSQKTFNNTFTLAGGLRFDKRTLNSDKLILDGQDNPVAIEDSTTYVKFYALQNNFNGVSGSIGISYQLNPTNTFKLNLSRGFRAPNISELASNGRHEGTLRYEYGNPDLKSEISHQIDAAYFYNSDHLSFEVTPFVNFISNFIYSAKLTNAMGQDSIPDPSENAPAYQFTQGNTTLLGGEVYVDIHPHPFDWLHIENSISYVQATQQNQTDSTRYLPFIPAPKYRAVLKAEFKKAGNYLSGVYAKVGLDYYFAQNKIFAAYGTETSTSAYSLLSVGLGANIKVNGKKDFASIFISAENLANVAYQSHLSRLKYAPQNVLTGRNGVYNMGRNVSMKLVINI